MKKPIIALDIDEVIFPFVAGAAEHHNQHYGTALTQDDFNTFDFWNVWGGTREDTIQKLDDFILRSNHLHLQPIKGAQDAIRLLSKNYDIVLVTARNERLRDATTTWFKEHMPALFEHIHYAGNKYDGHAYRSKLEVCRDLRATLLIDDAPHNVIECSKGGMKTILFGDYPWQTAQDIAKLPPTVVRCKDWTEVLHHLGIDRTYDESSK